MTTHIDRADLVAQLRTWATGDYRIEAAVDLLAAHGVWLHRDDFTDRCVRATEPDLVRVGLPCAWLDFDEAGRIAEGGPASLPASDSELQILAITASLADAQVDRPLHELVTGLDDRNVALVLDAVAHAAGWHETGHSYTVTGHLPRGDRVSRGDHTPAGKTRADLAVELLDRVDRRVADPNAVAVAQVHATLAVAEVLLDIHSRLGDLAYRGGCATPPASPLGDATPVRSAHQAAG